MHVQKLGKELKAQSQTCSIPQYGRFQSRFQGEVFHECGPGAVSFDTQENRPTSYETVGKSTKESVASPCTPILKSEFALARKTWNVR